MQRLEVSGAVRPIYGLLGVKRLRNQERNLTPPLQILLLQQCFITKVCSQCYLTRLCI